MQFSELGLIAPIAQAVAAEGYVSPTPIQAKAIPHVLAGRDLLGLAQTGTGKTAAFALPILQRLAHISPGKGHRYIRCLVLTPTRELAAQIGDSFRTYGKHLPLRYTVIFGGVATGTVAVESLDKDLLPADMKNKSTDEIKAEITERAAKRGAAQAELAKMSKERAEYLKAHEKEAGDGFDVKVKQTVDRELAK